MSAGLWRRRLPGPSSAGLAVPMASVLRAYNIVEKNCPPGALLQAQGAGISARYSHVPILSNPVFLGAIDGSVQAGSLADTVM
jgi:hypothetical protein